MASIVHFPDFMNNNLELSAGKLNKLIYFFYGILIGFIHKNTNGRLFCSLMNLFFRKESKIYYEDGFYSKKINQQVISYPNKRIDRVIIDYKKHLNHFMATYCLDNLSFTDGDLILDCGANVGELFYGLSQKDLKFRYVGFEPDPITFKCLEKNLNESKNEFYNIALGEKDGLADLFLDSEGGDSSLVYFGKTEKIQVETRALDSFNFGKIKLFKLEAEGYEFEVLKGSKNTLKNIELISVDYGPEKGVNKETSIANVTNYLYENGFSIIEGSKYRHIGLFINNKILNI